MSAHTEGPWYAVQQNSDGNWYVEDPYGVTCRVFGGEDEAEANARLIATAPEMLEALRAVDRFGSPLGPILRQKVRAALAKAEGREVTT